MKAAREESDSAGRSGSTGTGWGLAGHTDGLRRCLRPTACISGARRTRLLILYLGRFGDSLGQSQFQWPCLLGACAAAWRVVRRALRHHVTQSAALLISARLHRRSESLATKRGDRPGLAPAWLGECRASLGRPPSSTPTPSGAAAARRCRDTTTRNEDRSTASAATAMPREQASKEGFVTFV